MVENETQRNFKQWFNAFLVISEGWQGYEWKAYVVFNHHPQLQPKKLSRMWDIPNFPTQDWADTALCTINWNCTYPFQFLILFWYFDTLFKNSGTILFSPPTKMHQSHHRRSQWVREFYVIGSREMIWILFIVNRLIQCKYYLYNKKIRTKCTYM